MKKKEKGNFKKVLHDSKVNIGFVDMVNESYTRKIDGHRYVMQDSSPDKDYAMSEAKRLRAEGKHVRIIKVKVRRFVKKVYAIYVKD